MPFTRALVSWGPVASPVRDWFSNTLYFNVSGSVGQDPDYDDLASDLLAIYQNQSWTIGCKIEVRFYDMADAKPRPEKAYKTATKTGTIVQAAPQVAIALSYYADRNLPLQRGRIFTGPWANSSQMIAEATRLTLITFAQALAGLGGLNVDWSVYSPTSQQRGLDPWHRRISDVWVDNSWDIIRSRKLASTARSTAQING